ncbi:MAG: SH3 domain-containing protein, partial [Clostridia bacterium]|nr:SH3 domain-containing protein [Clostridia bacterium]
SGEKHEEIRELLREESYTGQNGMTYEEYLGLPQNEGDLGRTSSGIEVKNLQCRLQALGLYAGDATGKYDSKTVNAVKEFQRMKGYTETGVASKEFQEKIYAEDAPTAMNVTLSEGMNGPVVKKLQENLSVLKLYEGNIDGIYDLDVAEAVKRFQKAYTFPMNGIASSKVQKAIHYEAGKINATFSENAGYTLEVEEDEMYFGVIEADTGIRIREKPSTDSEALGRVTDGDYVIALKYGEYWSQIQFGKCVGYIMNKYADYSKQELLVLKYTATDDDRIYTIGHTAEEYKSGADLPSDLFEKYLAAEGSLDDYEGLVSYVTVDTDEGVAINLRQSPSTSAEVLASLPSGAQAKVILRSSEWTLVSADGQEGYLMNDYLEFWSGPADALDPVDEEAADEEMVFEEIYALSAPQRGDSALVYDMDSDDATLLGRLKKGIEVKIVKSDGKWCLIEYKDHQGYIKADELSFSADYALEQA